MIKRLQGKEWEEKKDDLEETLYYENVNGNIKCFYRDKQGRIYSHWLNDKEKEEHNGI